MKIKPLLIALSLAVTPLAFAETPAADDAPKATTLVKVDDFDVTNMHFGVFSAQNAEALAKPGGQVALLNELVNTFVVAHSAEAQKLANDPKVKAAMEVAQARLLVQALIRNFLETAPVDQAKLEAAYKTKYVDNPSEEYKARHILVATEDEAKALIKQLNEGADFADLAKTHSTGPSKTVGGDLGWFTADAMVKPFGDALAELQDGKISQAPVKTQFGWHVILREQSRKVPVPTLEAVHDELAKEVRAESLGDFIRELRAKAKIEVVAAEGSGKK